MGQLLGHKTAVTNLAGIINQNVDSPALSPSLVHDRGHRIGLINIASNGNGLTASVINLLRQGL